MRLMKLGTCTMARATVPRPISGEFLDFLYTGTEFLDFLCTGLLENEFSRHTLRGSVSEFQYRVYPLNEVYLLNEREEALLPGAHRRDHQRACPAVFAIAFVMLIEQRKRAFAGCSRARQFRR
jgi:hypothetical protein